VRFGSYRGRLVLVFVGLFTVIQALSFVVVSAWVRVLARQEIEEELRLAGSLFIRQLELRTEQLVTATRLLSGDFALKTTVATTDHRTTWSVLENHRRRIGADVLMMVGLDGTVVADTLHPDRHGAVFPLRRLLDEAEDQHEASDLVALDGGLYRLAVATVLAPIPIGWLGAGFVIDDRTAGDLRDVTGLHVSFLRRDAGGVAVAASTLSAPDRTALSRDVPAARAAGLIALGGEPHVVRAERVSDDVLVVLQRPLAEALAPYERLRRTLLAVAAVGVVLAFVGASMLARRVSRPVLALAEAARRVARGDFAAGVAIPQRDELGELGATFNEMVSGLRERDRVRSELERAGRLKRFFSPQVAEALSSGDESILASRRREITVVFCDLRGFTAFAETADPEEVMGLLRDYHATVGPVVFAHEGTLERFTGDGLMVFFNDPIPCADHAVRAVRMAIAMRDAVGRLLAAWRARGHALGVGTGIAMGYATVGRIGFEGRFDYAAIGRVTNLSARLCQEAEDGQILISQRVHAEVAGLVDAVPLGAFTLKGFGTAVAVFNVLGLQASAPPAAVPPGAASKEAT
jgi:adenylate cyclase